MRDAPRSTSVCFRAQLPRAQLPRAQLSRVSESELRIGRVSCMRALRIWRSLSKRSARPLSDREAHFAVGAGEADARVLGRLADAHLSRGRRALVGTRHARHKAAVVV